jgi:hypothetical protein
MHIDFESALAPGQSKAVAANPDNGNADSCAVDCPVFHAFLSSASFVVQTQGSALTG